MVLYVVGIAAAWLLAPWPGLAFFVVVALMWMRPDRRIDKVVAQ